MASWCHLPDNKATARKAQLTEGSCRRLHVFTEFTLKHLAVNTLPLSPDWSSSPTGDFEGAEMKLDCCCSAELLVSMRPI